MIPSVYHARKVRYGLTKLAPKKGTGRVQEIYVCYLRLDLR